MNTQEIYNLKKFVRASYIQKLAMIVVRSNGKFTADILSNPESIYSEKTINRVNQITDHIKKSINREVQYRPTPGISRRLGAR